MPANRVSGTATGQIRRVCREFWSAAASLGRAATLIHMERPETPLRLLCIAALDTLHRLQFRRPLHRDQVEILAKLLDFAAMANAIMDHKPCSPEDYRRLRGQLLDSDCGDLVAQYVRQLQLLERERPRPGGTEQTFAETRRYRESVAALSLDTLVAAAFPQENQTPEDAPQPSAGTHAGTGPDNRQLLLAIIMQCQIIDDVLDFSGDSAAQLPSFLTSIRPHEQAIFWTAAACREYARHAAKSAVSSAVPFRLSLWLMSVIARLVIVLHHFEFRLAGNDGAALAQSESARITQPFTDI